MQDYEALKDERCRSRNLGSVVRAFKGFWIQCRQWNLQEEMFFCSVEIVTHNFVVHKHSTGTSIFLLQLPLRQRRTW